MRWFRACAAVIAVAVVLFVSGCSHDDERDHRAAYRDHYDDADVRHYDRYDRAETLRDRYDDGPYHRHGRER